MALTFPLTAGAFADLLRIQQATLSLSRNDQVSGLGNGQPLNAELASPLWRAEISTGPIPNQDAEGIIALIEVLEHPGRDFYLYNPRKQGPRYDPEGVILGADEPVLDTLDSNNHQLRIGALPNGYVLARGDMFAFDYGPVDGRRRAVHRIVENVTSSSGGLTPLVEVFPHIRSGVNVGEAITLIKPAMRAKIIPGSFSSAGEGAHQRITFGAIQKLI